MQQLKIRDIYSQTSNEIIEGKIINVFKEDILVYNANTKFVAIVEK